MLRELHPCQVRHRDIGNHDVGTHLPLWTQTRLAESGTIKPKNLIAALLQDLFKNNPNVGVIVKNEGSFQGAMSCTSPAL